jgi:hypothetical protein
MQFRKWLIKEMAHISIDEPIDIGDQKNVSMIDMQFELYPDMTQTTLAHWIVNGFAAKVPNSNYYIVFDGKTGKAKVSDSTENKMQVPGEWHKMAYMSSDMPAWKSA